jgi:DNA-binding LytR/AlgR family response regulator
MEEKIKILVVEDDLVEFTHLEILLGQLGHTVLAHVDNAIDAITAFGKERPDLVIADISINGEIDGIQLVHKLNEIDKIPVLFLTSHDENVVFAKAKETEPYAYITKPVEPRNLERNIELAFQNFGRTGTTKLQWERDVLVKDFFFTKIGDKLKKIPTDGIEFIEVEGKYCSISVLERKYHVKISLKVLLLRLPVDQFVRVSRNFVVNINKVEHIDIQIYQLIVGNTEIPISRTYKDELMKRIRLI